MDFCPKCGTIMIPIKKKSHTILVCRKCGYSQKKSIKSVKITETPKKDNRVVILEKDTTSLPKIEKECPKCGHNQVYWWMQQTRGTDEPPTQFFRCVKCKGTWREYK